MSMWNELSILYQIIKERLKENKRINLLFNKKNNGEIIIKFLIKIIMIFKTKLDSKKLKKNENMAMSIWKCPKNNIQ